MPSIFRKGRAKGSFSAKWAMKNASIASASDRLVGLSAFFIALEGDDRG
jgi:hypothetical protein